MKRPFLILLGFTFLIIVSLAFTEHKDPGYKNLQILPKDITEKQMDSVMNHFNESLTVKCDFCHVKKENKEELDFPSDNNPHKNKAREMMKQVFYYGINGFSGGHEHHDFSRPF